MSDSRNILVTGGAGYIGSHACKALAQAGFTPITYDSLERGHRWAVKWGPLEVGDIRNRDQLEQVFEKYRPEAVMHFAAYAYVGESVECPAIYYRNNVVGSLTLLEVMQKQGVGKLVFSSTCATYGIPESIPIREDHPQRPVNPYGNSKLMIEQMLKDFGEAYGLHSVSLRYFNAAGADSDGEIGEAHDPEPHLIPRVFEVAAGHRSHIDIYGNDYNTPDGTCVRDYIHVNDLADAHVLALRWLLNGGETRVYNLGNGKGYSVNEVVEIARRVTGCDINVNHVSRRAGDPAVLVADSSLIRSELGWRPGRGLLETQISDAWQWFAAS